MGRFPVFVLRDRIKRFLRKVVQSHANSLTTGRARKILCMERDSRRKDALRDLPVQSGYMKFGSVIYGILACVGAGARWHEAAAELGSAQWRAYCEGQVLLLLLLPLHPRSVCIRASHELLSSAHGRLHPKRYPKDPAILKIPRSY